MSPPTAMQSIARTLRCRACIKQSLLAAPTVVYPVRQPYRQYATEKDTRKKFELPEEYAEEVFNALANNPSVMQAMHHVIEAFNKRGMKLDKEPSVHEMWKIMKDKEIITALENLSKAGKASGVQLDHILKSLPWDKEAEKWAKQDLSDPLSSDYEIQERIKKIKKILSRPDPVTPPPDPKAVNPSSVLEDDTTEDELNDEDEMSLGEVQSDLRGWWKGNEEQVFYERLARFKAQKGERLTEDDVFDFWIDEWSSKVKENVQRR